MRLFALQESADFGAQVARSLHVDLSRHEERFFDGGEHKARPLESVRGKDVYVIQTLGADAVSSVNDRLCKLLFFIATCRDNGAGRVTAIVPFLCYSRKDRQTKSRDPVTTRFVAQLFEAMGTDALITLDVHNIAAFQNAFRCRTVHIYPHDLFAPVIKTLAEEREVVIFSPDAGGIKRAQLLKESYERFSKTDVGFGMMEKRRSRGVVSGDLFAGEVEGASVFIIDDMIGSGGTVLRAARACRAHGAKSVHALATHGLFGKGSELLFDDPAVDHIVTTDSLLTAVKARELHPSKLELVAVAPRIAETIRRLHAGEPVTGLTGLED